jgi:hypothetical protein
LFDEQALDERVDSLGNATQNVTTKGSSESESSSDCSVHAVSEQSVDVYIYSFFCSLRHLFISIPYKPSGLYKLAEQKVGFLHIHGTLLAIKINEFINSNKYSHRRRNQRTSASCAHRWKNKPKYLASIAQNYIFGNWQNSPTVFSPYHQCLFQLCPRFFSLRTFLC